MSRSARESAHVIHELCRPGGSGLAAQCSFPEASAVLGGNQPGWVFVDDVKRPRSALVWAQGMRGFYLVGDADNASFAEELDAHAGRVLEPRLQDLGVAWFEISGDENWHPVIERAFAKRNLTTSQQLVYEATPVRRKSVIHRGPLDGCLLSSLEQCLLADHQVTNKAFPVSKLSRFWGGVDAFLGTGMGYALVVKGEIASLCLSAFVVKNIHVVDIETRAAYQRRGYAQIVAQAFIAACNERRFRLHWDCMAENAASVRLAESLGLTRRHAYTLYSFPL